LEDKRRLRKKSVRGRDIWGNYRRGVARAAQILNDQKEAVEGQNEAQKSREEGKQMAREPVGREKGKSFK